MSSSSRTNNDRDDLIYRLKLFRYTLNDDGTCRTQDQATLLRSHHNLDMTRYTILHQYDAKSNELDNKYVQTALETGEFDTLAEDKAIGSMLGNVVGDALGAPLEFQPLRYGVQTVGGMGDDDGRRGAFRLLAGQWTDDSSMCLCLSESLLARGQFDPIDNMLRYINWWNHGYCNSFGDDDGRGSKHSVGLGGNISQSFWRFPSSGSPYTQAGTSETSGVGSLMRLSPVPIFYHNDHDQGVRVARKSSLVTHKGEEAAECCRLLAHILITCINSDKRGDTKILDTLADSFTSQRESVNCLAKGIGEGDGKNPDRMWNWKDDEYRYSPKRAAEQPGYIGSYAMDGLSMALHCVYTTNDFKSCLLKAVNLCGDADSVGAIAGQLCGAIYGASSIPTDWVRAVQRWDRGGQIALRAYRLYHHRFPPPLPPLTPSPFSSSDYKDSTLSDHKKAIETQDSGENVGHDKSNVDDKDNGKNLTISRVGSSRDLVSCNSSSSASSSANHTRQGSNTSVAP